LPIFFEIINYINDNLLAENLLSTVAVHDFIEGDNERIESTNEQD